MADISTTIPNLANQTKIANALIKIADKYEKICDIIYPVGSIYITVNNVNPDTLFGGKWEQIEGKFLLAASSDYGAGEEGGEAEHTLTIDEMPTHGHNSNNYTDGFMAHKIALSGTWSNDEKLAVSTNGRSVVWVSQNPPQTGGGGSHNNMPPYIVVYIWKRTA